MRAEEFMSPAQLEQVRTKYADELKPKTKAVKIPQPTMSPGEAQLELCLRVEGLPMGEVEYKFDQGGRGWRFDRAWPQLLFAVEIEGLTYDGGRHQRIDGFTEDLRKYGAAMMQGWDVYRCTPAMLGAGDAMTVIRYMLERNTNKNTGNLCE